MTGSTETVVLDVDGIYLGVLAAVHGRHLDVACRQRGQQWCVPAQLVQRVVDGGVRLKVSRTFLLTGAEPCGLPPAYRSHTRTRARNPALVSG